MGEDEFALIAQSIMCKTSVLRYYTSGCLSIMKSMWNLEF
jgi:hypothetical protein